jgi:hypothetical protein
MKRLAALILLLGLATPAHAMVTPLFQIYGVSGDSGRYHPFSGAYTNSVTQGVNATPSPLAGTVQNARLHLSAAPGTGNSTSWTLYVNGSASSVVVTVSDSATDGIDTTHNATVAQGDLLEWKNVHTGGSFSPNEFLSCSFTSTNANESLLTGGSNSVPNSATHYYPISGTFTNTVTTEASAETVMPTAGTLDNLYIYGNNGSGPGAGTSYTFTLYKNGVATALTTAISGSTRTNSDTTHSISFVAGDTISLEAAPSGTPVQQAILWSIRFKPTVDGESIQTAGGALNTGGTYYSPISDFIQSNNADSRFIANYTAYSPVAFTLKTLYANTQPAPGGATSYTFRNWKNGSLASISAAVSGASTQGSDTTHSDSYASGDSIVIERVTSGSVSSVTGGTAFVSYIAPPAPPSSGTSIIGLVRALWLN